MQLTNLLIHWTLASQFSRVVQNETVSPFCQYLLATDPKWWVLHCMLELGNFPLLFRDKIDNNFRLYQWNLILSFKSRAPRSNFWQNNVMWLFHISRARNGYCIIRWLLIVIVFEFNLFVKQITENLKYWSFATVTPFTMVIWNIITNDSLVKIFQIIKVKISWAAHDLVEENNFEKSFCPTLMFVLQFKKIILVKIQLSTSLWNKNLNANQFIRIEMSDTHKNEFYFVELRIFIIRVIIRKNDSRRNIIKMSVTVHEQDIK